MSFLGLVFLSLGLVLTAVDLDDRGLGVLIVFSSGKSVWINLCRIYKNIFLWCEGNKTKVLKCQNKDSGNCRILLGEKLLKHSLMWSEYLKLKTDD